MTTSMGPPGGPSRHATPPTSGSAAGDGGRFGSWATDDEGLPCFDLAPGLTGTVDDLDRDPADLDPDDLVLPEGGAPAVWHRVGGTAIAATAHAGGWVSLYETARGMVRLTGEQASWGTPGFDPDSLRVRFGCGYAEWQAAAGGLHLRRRVSAPPDETPALRIDVTVSGRRTGVRWYEERWAPDAHPLIVGALMSPYTPPPAGFALRDATVWRMLYSASAAVRGLTHLGRRLAAPLLQHPPRRRDDLRGFVVPPRFPVSDAPPASQSKPAWVDLRLPWLAVVALDDGPPCDVAPPSVRLSMAVGDDDLHLAFAVVLAPTEDDIPALLDRVRTWTPSGNSAGWGRLLEVEIAEAPAVAREARWHATELVGAQQRDEYLGGSYVSQGSAYGYVHGLQGAPRDYAIYAAALAVVDPSASRRLLETIMGLTSRRGPIHYAHTGRGQCVSGGIHAEPSDLSLFFLWALTEYVFATGDRALLDRSLPFWPVSRGTATVRERVLLAFRDVAERVGVGDHGLLRVGSGDWADPISAMVADRRAFHEKGESAFNTGLAAYALPRAAALIDDRCPAEALAFRALGSQLADALADAWNGRWFLRGWDGRGAPVGDDHLFLDGQVWALIAQVGSDAQRARTVAEIARRCDEPSPIGATILDRPHPVRFGMLAPGWDCNGGVWAAIGGLLAWAYARHDPALAWRALQKQSLAAHAAAYPHVWYGIWSGPDAYNGWFGERPGETFVQPATPMTEFPVMNANAHAGPLLALQRVLGIETSPEGIVVRERRDPIPPWRFETVLGSWSA